MAVTISQGTSLSAPLARLTPAGFPGGNGPMSLSCAMAADDRRSAATTNLAVFTIYNTFRSSLCRFPFLNHLHNITIFQRRLSTPAAWAGVMRCAPLIFTKL